MLKSSASFSLHSENLILINLFHSKFICYHHGINDSFLTTLSLSVRIHPWISWVLIFVKEIKSAMPSRPKNKPVKLKRVGAVSMCGFLFKVAWKIDDSNCLKWTFLWNEKYYFHVPSWTFMAECAWGESWKQSWVTKMLRRAIILREKCYEVMLSDNDNLLW